MLFAHLARFMKILFFLLLSLISAHPAFAVDLVHKATFNGQPVAANGKSWKSTARIHAYVNGQYTFCTGVFLERDLLITAAHCRLENDNITSIDLFRGNDPDPVIIPLGAGTYSYARHPSYRKVAREDYTPTPNDLAIIVLKSERLPDDFQPADILTQQNVSASDPGKPALLVGAGTTQSGEMSDRLYFVQGKIEFYAEGSLAIVGFPGRTGTCGGDSGGPLFVKNGSELLLLGILISSTDDLNVQCGTRATFNTLSATKFNWIESKANSFREAF